MTHVCVQYVWWLYEPYSLVLLTLSHFIWAFPPARKARECWLHKLCTSTCDWGVYNILVNIVKQRNSELVKALGSSSSLGHVKGQDMPMVRACAQLKFMGVIRFWSRVKVNFRRRSRVKIGVKNLDLGCGWKYRLFIITQPISPWKRQFNYFRGGRGLTNLQSSQPKFLLLSESSGNFEWDCGQNEWDIGLTIVKLKGENTSAKTKSGIVGDWSLLHLNSAFQLALNYHKSTIFAISKGKLKAWNIGQWYIRSLH